MRITNTGGMTYCRWSDKTQAEHSIQDQTPVQFFQHTMQPIRNAMLQGHGVSGCGECYQMERYGKVSGRQKQLLKIGVQVEQFEKTLCSSPWRSTLANSEFDLLPQDWQVDLGNHCNSACVFCGPESSSRLAAEQFKLGMIDAMPRASWTERPELLQKFFDVVSASRHIQYMHFIGGETLITPAFSAILQQLIDQGLHRSLTIGFTTNLTVWPEAVIEQLSQFVTVNVGVSVEAFTPINDYVRWPSSLPVVEQNFARWLELSRAKNWYVQIRSTPTVLSVADMLTLYDRAWQEGVAVESCNFLQNPTFLRPTVLPMTYRTELIEQFQQWLSQHQTQHNDTVLNIRNPNVVHQQICEDLASYVRYFINEPDESYRLPDLVQYLKRIESVRGNSILDYRPNYENVFRSAGY
jgi:sulfatase maturation enzyme AslB (radical SAM superfamily)